MSGPGPSFDLATVDLSDGLTEQQIAASRAAHGTNDFAPLPTKSWKDFAAEAFADPMLRILVACAAVAIAVGIVEKNPTEGIAIVCAIVVVAAVSVRNQLKAQRDYTALDAQSAAVAVRVIRNGRVVEVDSSQLVVGDLLEINTGDVAAADVVLARGKELLVDESHITGEPDATKKVDDTVYAGSRILDGSGRALVSVVGDDTLLGGIRAKLGAEREATPLEERLEILAGRIGRVGIAIAVLTAAVMIISAAVRGEWLHEGITESFEFGLNGDTGKMILFAATAAFTIIVVAVPEGLPLAVTLALSYTTRRMAADSILVRELPACETMGAGTIICTDKTGTLTEGSMSLAYVWVGGTAHETKETTPELLEIAGHTIEGFAINSSADLTLEDGDLRVLGNATEGGILSWMDPRGSGYRDLRDDAEIIERREFSSSRKHMATLVQTGSGPVLHLKGAPEIVVGMCSQLSADASLDGPTTPLDDAGRQEIVQLVKGYASRGYRTLAIAARRVEAGVELDDADQDLTFQALFVLADPIRPEVPLAVANCQKAGVDVMIITGDIPETAAEIGRQAGIVSSVDNVVDGSVFRTWDDDQIKAAQKAGKMQALARALPEDKERLVGLLQEEGHVVGMTGDGVNDAPALKKADIGFAMGSGSQVAREASDVVIVDDNFVSLVSSIRWGRGVFENIRKFVQFQLTVNVVALVTAFTSALFGFGTPLTAVQLLWVNLIMDSFAALALALEPPTDKLFDEKPHGRTAPLISRQMIINILVVGLAMFATMMLILNTPDTFGLPDADAQHVELTQEHLDEAAEDGISIAQKQDREDQRAADLYRNSFLFNVFVWMQIFNAFNARSIRADRTPFSNLRNASSFLGIIGLIVVLQLIIMAVGGSVFSITQLDAAEWVKSIAIGFLVIPIGFAMRALGRALGTPADE